jgi:hypothetical protein
VKYEAGQAVIVDFDGIEHRGEVISHRRGDVVATIELDLVADYGGITPMMAPHQTVCIPERKVRPVDQPNEP